MITYDLLGIDRVHPVTEPPADGDLLGIDRVQPVTEATS